MTISIQGLDKAAVLAALYNRAQPQGMMGFLHYNPKPMTAAEAQALLAQTTYFDYVKGRVMKVNLAKDEFDPSLYDRDNGRGAAQEVIDTLRASGNTNDPTIAKAHSANAAAQARDTQAHLGTETRFGRHGMTLGLADMAEHLGPKVRKVLNRS